MKLNFEISASEADLINAEGGEFALPLLDETPADKLRAGIEAARAGERDRARILLVEAAQIEPGSEEVWMWLASVSEYPEELLGFLERALELNPNNERALQWSRETKSLLSKTFAERAARRDYFAEHPKQIDARQETADQSLPPNEIKSGAGSEQNAVLFDFSGCAEKVLPSEYQAAPPQNFDCPFCSRENEPQSFLCPSCLAMLSLSDLETLLSYEGANREIVRQAVERAESESGDLSADELKFLGVGQINLKDFRAGLASLRRAVQANPNDVVLEAQVNALAIRLAEIERQASIHLSMPRNKTILIVDDSETVRRLICGKLEKNGHEVICAVDGLDALEKIETVVPDLILLDITMPRMDGYQVCRLLRANAKTRDVPIVMISGKDGFIDKVRGRIAGTTGYITKPFGPETLMKTVENYIV